MCLAAVFPAILVVCSLLPLPASSLPAARVINLRHPLTSTAPSTQFPLCHQRVSLPSPALSSNDQIVVLLFCKSRNFILVLFLPGVSPRPSKKKSGNQDPRGFRKGWLQGCPVVIWAQANRDTHPTNSKPCSQSGCVPGSGR